MSLQLDRLTVTRPNGEAMFAPLTLTVETGCIASVMGPSGMGKSTLLAAIGGHLAPGFRTQGHVLLTGRDVTHLPAEKRGVGIMFQEAVLFPHLSVADNLAFGLSARVRGRAARRAAVEAALGQAGLDGMGQRDPATLSGGQRARAALMRTLLSQPCAILLDEPFSSLDPELRQDIRAFVFDSIRRAQIPALLVTHDVKDAEASGGGLIGLAPAAATSAGRA
ncbi:ATP-binding cassette domain-containing protein [Falsirhodobacter sp. alg1]|uniref:ATP-binding cassette domain-containing protein n=1 Tax=Falsirhodobacter sp. alg1 TaxID=1472418 RepID=UPI00078967F6|nr:ATP-binding cassette domain-containing protein [Falsirhodobacter sp. alg1]